MKKTTQECMNLKSIIEQQAKEIACSTKVAQTNHSMPVSGQLNKKQVHINDTFDINYFNEDFQPSLGESTLAEPNNRRPPINTVGEPINRFEAPRARSNMFPIPNIGEGGRMPQQSTNYGTTWHENQRRTREEPRNKRGQNFSFLEGEIFWPIR